MEVKMLFIVTQFLILSTMVQAQYIAEEARAVEAVPITVQGYKLNGFKYKEFKSASSLTCSQRCLSEFPKCVSYNHLTKMGESVCELNSKGISSMAEGLAGKLDKEPSSVFAQLQSASMDCADHYKSGSRVSGFYYVRYQDDMHYRVYCDMQSEPNKVFMLVTSWSFNNKGLRQFRTKPYSLNDPLNEDEPNWEKYRMSLARMKHFRSRSTHWRITCNFPQDGLSYRDYVRAKFSTFDFISLSGSNVCKKVEFINVRGNTCSECTVAWWQESPHYILHHDSSVKSCQLRNSPGGLPNEDDFGYYAAYNKQFRCCNSLTSTTNVWIGSNV